MNTTAKQWKSAETILSKKVEANKKCNELTDEEIASLNIALKECCDEINNKNFNIFEFSPELQAIKHIANNWFGKMNVKYVMTFADNGDTIINNINTINLNNTKYFEYAISIEKTFYNTNIHATVGRQDGDLYGWFGNINIKYLF